MPKLHTSSNVTPIRPGMITVVDLGDTSHSLGPFVMSTSEDPHVDQSPLLFTHTESPAPVVDLTRRSKIRELSLHCSNPKSSLRGGPGFKDTLVATAQETAASHSFGQTKTQASAPKSGSNSGPVPIQGDEASLLWILLWHGIYLHPHRESSSLFSLRLSSALECSPVGILHSIQAQF